MNLLALTDCYVESNDYSLEGGVSQNLYPSEASVEIETKAGKKILGHCNRATYYRIKNVKKTNSTTARGYHIMNMGKAIETYLIEVWKNMGILVAEDVRFMVPKIGVSGRLDAVVKNKGTDDLIGIEIKTVYGYHNQKGILGNKNTEGFPKDNHLLQTIIYADFFRDNKFKNGQNIKYFKTIYLFRDNAMRAEFDISIIDVGKNKHACVNGKTVKEFSVEDIYTRYEQVRDFIMKEELPPRDFELSYNEEKIRTELKAGNIGKTKVAKWEKNPSNPDNNIGDWQCSYCSWLDECYKKGK